MIKKLLFLAFTLSIFSSCEIGTNDPYTEYAYRTIASVHVSYNNSQNYETNYYYDTSGYMLGIEDTYSNTYDQLTYGYDQNGNIINVRNSNGLDRDLHVDGLYYTASEITYQSNVVVKESDYSYWNDRLSFVRSDTYNTFGTHLYYEEHDFNYNSAGSLVEYIHYYDDNIYYKDTRITFSNFSNILNSYNIDLISIMGFHMESDHATRIGRAGVPSTYLPSRVVISIEENGILYEDTIYYIEYVMRGDYVSQIVVTNNLGQEWFYTLTYI